MPYVQVRRVIDVKLDQVQLGVPRDGGVGHARAELPLERPKGGREGVEVGTARHGTRAEDEHLVRPQRIKERRHTAIREGTDCHAVNARPK